MSQDKSPKPLETKTGFSWPLVAAVVFLIVSFVAGGIVITGFDFGSPTPASPPVEASTPTPQATLPAPQAAITIAPTELAAAAPRWVIRVAPLTSAAPDMGGKLSSAVQSSVQSAGIDPASVKIETTALPVSISRIGDLSVERDLAGTNLLVTWESGGDGLLKIYLVDANPPGLPSLDAMLTPWTVSAPGDVPIVASATGDLSLPAGFVAGTLELWGGAGDSAAQRFQALQGLPSDAPPDQQAGNQAVILFGVAQSLVLQGNLPAALESYSNAIRLHNDFPVALLDRANVYLSLGDSTTALSVYQSAQQDGLLSYTGLYNTVIATRNAADPVAALASANMLVDARPQAITGFNLRGIIHYQQGDYPAALGDFISAGFQAPDNVTILHNQAKTYNALQQYDKAIETYDTLLRLDPTDARLHLEQGLVYQAAGDDARASEGIDQAIALDNQFAEAYVARARLELKQAKLNEAITDAKQALTISPDSGEAFRIMADSFLEQEEFKQAEDAYSKALDRGAEEASVYAGRGWARHRQRKINLAIKDYEQALSMGLTDPTLLFRLGFADYDAGQEAASLDAFQRAVSGGLDTAEAHAGLALALDSNLKRAQADDEYKRALQLDPKFGDREFLKSQPLWSSGSIGRAMSIVKRLK